MGRQAPVMRNAHAAKHDMIPRRKGMHVETLADAERSHGALSV
jgi:hypothetical protein